MDNLWIASRSPGARDQPGNSESAASAPILERSIVTLPLCRPA